jgi:hypothetical protein
MTRLHFSEAWHRLAAILRFVKMHGDQFSNLTHRGAFKNIA